jgi:MOSC domain-containing protein YiiM
MTALAGIQVLLSRFPRPGRVEWIGVRPQRRAPVRALTEVAAVAGRGLDGDHYRPGLHGVRQVTLIQAEHLAVIGGLLGQVAPAPEFLRRNLVVSGISLLALKGMCFQVGEAVLEGTGLCHPCSRMEEVLGGGGYNAMRGHGGLNARIVCSGRIRVGDAVAFLGPAPDSPCLRPLVLIDPSPRMAWGGGITPPLPAPAPARPRPRAELGRRGRG